MYIIDFLVKMSPQKTLSSIICWFFGTNRKTNIHICVCICGDERQIRMFVFVLEMETHALMSYSKTNMRVCVCLYGDGNTRIDVLWPAAISCQTVLTAPINDPNPPFMDK